MHNINTLGIHDSQNLCLVSAEHSFYVKYIYYSSIHVTQCLYLNQVSVFFVFKITSQQFFLYPIIEEIKTLVYFWQSHPEICDHNHL